MKWRELTLQKTESKEKAEAREKKAWMLQQIFWLCGGLQKKKGTTKVRNLNSYEKGSEHEL